MATFTQESSASSESTVTMTDDSERPETLAKSSGKRKLETECESVVDPVLPKRSRFADNTPVGASQPELSSTLEDIQASFDELRRALELPAGTPLRPGEVERHGTFKLSSLPDGKKLEAELSKLRNTLAVSKACIIDLRKDLNGHVKWREEDQKLIGVLKRQLDVSLELQNGFRQQLWWERGRFERELRAFDGERACFERERRAFEQEKNRLEGINVAVDAALKEVKTEIEAEISTFYNEFAELMDSLHELDEQCKALVLEKEVTCNDNEVLRDEIEAWSSENEQLREELKSLKKLQSNEALKKENFELREQVVDLKMTVEKLYKMTGELD